MSAIVTGMVFAQYPGGGGELLLALALGDHAHDDGTRIFPSVAALASKTRQSERTVQYQLRNMEDSGWLQKVRDEQRGRPGFAQQSRRGREYRISPEWMRGEPFARPSDEPSGPENEDQEKGANIAPFSHALDSQMGAIAVAPFPDGKGCNLTQKRVQSDAEKGATAIAPEPSVNHQYSNHQGKKRASAHDCPPDDPVRFHGAGQPDTLAEFSADWRPCPATESLLRTRKLPMPAAFVVDGFVAHWAGRWIAPRRIPNEFVKWISRQAGMNGGRVPTDADCGVPKADAEAAWAEVREANKRGQMPAAGWSHPRTAWALLVIGGFGSLRDMRTDQVPHRQREFVQAYIHAPPGAPAR